MTLTDAEFVALMHSTFGDDANDALQWSRDWRKLADSAFASGAASVRAVPRKPVAFTCAAFTCDNPIGCANIGRCWHDAAALSAAPTGEASE